MSDSFNFTEQPAEKIEKKPETSEVKKAVDAAKLLDKREAQKQRAALGQAIGKAYKSKGVIDQGDYRR